MYTETTIDQYVERFFELMGEDNLSNTQEQELWQIVDALGWTPEDLRDIAAQCARRAIYLNNTTQKV